MANIVLSTTTDPLMTPQTVGAHRVYLKLSLFDSWTEVPALHCDSVSFNAAPSYSTARLYWRYGVGKLPGESAFASVTRHGVNRYYVLIDFTAMTATGATLAFCGTVEIDSDRLDGEGSGRQALECYGMERLLDLQPIRTSWWEAVAGQTAVESGCGFIFNEGGKPNRTPIREEQTYLFANGLTDDAEYWTSHNIVEYLLARHAGIDFGEFLGQIAWTLVDDSEAVPKWDRPVVESHGRTVWEILNQLVPRQRMLSFITRLADLDEASPGALATIEIRPFTFAHEEIDLGDGDAIPANENLHTVAFAGDHTASVVVTKSSVDTCDRVIVEGALRTSTCTLMVVDGELEKGWSDELETDYETAASDEDDYPANTEPAERSRRNKDARSNDRVAPVFARFTFSEEFLTEPLTGASPIFPDDDDEGETHVVCPAELKILPELVLLSGHSYEGALVELFSVDPVTFTDGPYDRRPPLILTPLPDDPESDPDLRKWVDVTLVGQTADVEEDSDETNRHWSAEVRIPTADRSIVVRVHGQPQHVIAGEEFTALSPAAEHGEVDLAKFDYQEFTFTVTLQEDRRARGMWPTDRVIAEIPRVKYLFAGDKFRCDYVVPQTVVDVFPWTGVRQKSDGGYLQDDRPILEKIAKLAFQWYGTERTSVVITSSVIEPQLIPGCLLTFVGDRQVNACVTNLTLEIPRTTGTGSPGVPKATYTTQFGELDPLVMFPT